MSSLMVGGLGNLSSLKSLDSLDSLCGLKSLDSLDGLGDLGSFSGFGRIFVSRNNFARDCVATGDRFVDVFIMRRFDGRLDG